MNFDKIHKLALQVREEVQHDMGSDNMAGLCSYCSAILQDTLKACGIFSKKIKGTFTVGNPFFYYQHTHYWLEIEGHVIDITADQFNEELDNKQMSEIVINTYENLPRYKKEIANV